MRYLIGSVLLTFMLGMSACDRPAPKSTPTGERTTQAIAWREGDVDDAFAEAKEAGKPVLLYWGAKWCPPCNLMKQTLFQNPDFIAETRNFIPVHLDGDSKGAQAWGAAFGISGYPTVIILRADRSEVTRLAGGSTSDALANVLRVAAKHAGSTEDLLKRADDPARLSADDWQLLASFDWLDDPRHFGDAQKGAAFVARLSQAAPQATLKRHLALTSLIMRAGDGKIILSAAQQAQLEALLPAILSSYDDVKANRQELTDKAPDLVAAVRDPTARTTLGQQLIAALDRIAADDAVPLGDRISTIHADIALSKAANGGKVDAAVLAKVRQRVALADRLATDPSMRQAVMPTAGQLLADAGDGAGAQRLWKDELPGSIAPYYYMADLADLAESNKDTIAAIDWLKRAAETAQGPATRVQWAIQYSQGVLRMRADDKAAVASSAEMVIDALGQNNAGYAARTQKRTAAWAAKLRDWSIKHDGADLLGKLRSKIAIACGAGQCEDPLKA